MRTFKKVTIKKEKRKINLRKILIKKRHSRRRKIISLYESNRRITISNQTKKSLYESCLLKM